MECTRISACHTSCTDAACRKATVPIASDAAEPSIHSLRGTSLIALAPPFDASGQRDSAAAHFAIVACPWRKADSALHARRDAAHSRLAGTTMSRR